MEIKQQLKLSQQLVMTPQLQQAIRLLQLSRLELIDEIRKELDANPVLADDEIDPRPRDNTDRSAPSPLNSEQPVEERIGETERVEREVDMTQRAQEKKVQEVDWEQFLENRTLQAPLPSTRGGFEELPPIEQNLTRPANLQEHLMWQLQMRDFSEGERRFAELVGGNLDDKGYLDLKGIEREDGTRTPDLTIEDLAREADLDPEDAPDVLRLMQEFDPLGVCSRNLQECLRVQAEVYGFDELELAIIDWHLHNFEKHNYQVIARDLKIAVEDVYEAAHEIQKLESRPARNFIDTDDKTIAITPDVYVIKDGDRFVVLDNDRGVQRLYINEALTKQMLRDPHAKEFIGEKLRNAQWLIRAIEQRRKTISRVTTNKYVHTPQGLFELKYFFNSSIRRVADEDIASESVKQAIKKIIDEENKQSPLSDQAIVQILEQEHGIKIARRTVAKYREMLCILASSKRKKLF